MLYSHSQMSSAGREEHLSLTQEAAFQSVARKTVDLVMQEAETIVMNGNTKPEIALDHPDGKRKVAFLEEANVLVSPLNGADESCIDNPQEEEEEVLGEKGTVIKVKIATEDCEKGEHQHLERMASIEDPELIKQALHESSIAKESPEEAGGEEIDKVTRENTRKNSLIHTDIRMEIEEDENAPEDETADKSKDKKRSTLPRNFKKAFSTNFKKIRDSTSKLTKKPENAEKETVTTSHTIKLPSKSDISKGFSNAKRRLSKSLSMKESRHHPPATTTEPPVVDEDQLKPVNVVRGSGENDEVVSLNSSSISHGSCANGVDDKKMGVEELAAHLRECNAEDHDHSHHNHHHEHQHNGEPCCDEEAIVAKKANRLAQRPPPPRPAEGPLLSPMEAKPFRPEDQEILLKRSASHDPTTSPSDATTTVAPPRSKEERKMNQRSLTLNISPTSSVNGNLDVNDLDPTRFDGTYRAASGTLTGPQNRKLYRTRSDLDKERAMRSRENVSERKVSINSLSEVHSNYIDKLRKRMSLSTEKAQTLRQLKGESAPKQMEVYERQEVYSFSFSKKKAPQIKRRHTMLLEAQSVIQPLVARPKLQATLQRVNDPRNAQYLDPKFKSATLQRQPPPQMSGYYSPMSPSTGGGLRTLEVTDNEPMIKLPFANETKSQTAAERLEELTPFAFQEAPADAAELNDQTRNMVAKALTTLINSSESMKAADLHNEYSAFHWLDAKRNFKVLGFATGWAELVICEEATTKGTFIRLPRIENVPEGIAYPVYPLDSLVRNWLERRTTVPRIGSEPSYHADSFQSDLLQNCSLLVSLKELLSQSETYKLSESLRHCVHLAVLLSLDFVNSSAGTKDLSLELSPEHILICYSHANCLALFRLSEDSHDSMPNLMQLLGLPKETDLQEGIDLEMGQIKNFVKQSAAKDEKSFLMKTLEALSPPDWTALMLSRIGKLHL